jgi:hypothetical protein
LFEPALSLRAARGDRAIEVSPASPKSFRWRLDRLTLLLAMTTEGRFSQKTARAANATVSAGLTDASEMNEQDIRSISTQAGKHRRASVDRARLHAQTETGLVGKT